MIHKPSLVACNPLGCAPGDLKAMSTLPILRVRSRPRSAIRAAPAIGAAPASATNSRRLSMRFSFARERVSRSGTGSQGLRDLDFEELRRKLAGYEETAGLGVIGDSIQNVRVRLFPFAHQAR